MMNRRTFLYGLTLETLSAPLTIEAQQVAKTAQMGGSSRLASPPSLIPTGV